MLPVHQLSSWVSTNAHLTRAARPPSASPPAPSSTSSAPSPPAAPSSAVPTSLDLGNDVDAPLNLSKPKSTSSSSGSGGSSPGVGPSSHPILPFGDQPQKLLPSALALTRPPIFSFPGLPSHLASLPSAGKLSAEPRKMH